MSKKKMAIIALIALWFVTSIIVLKSSTKLTYLEYQYENENSDNYIEIENNNEYLEQKFKSPYGIIHGIAIKIGTFSRDNNSFWNVALIDEDGNILYSKDYNASLIDDNSFNLFEFDKNIKVKKDAEYLIRVSAINVNENTSIAFYVGSESDLSTVISNGTELSETLCFSIYGGDFDVWWSVYAIVISIALSFLIIRATIVAEKGNNPIDDKLVGSMLLLRLLKSATFNSHILQYNLAFCA